MLKRQEYDLNWGTLGSSDATVGREIQFFTTQSLPEKVA